MSTPIMILQLTQVSNDRVYVITIKSSKGEPKAEVPLPFNENQRKAVSLALEAQTFKPTDWETPEAAERLIALKTLGLADEHGFVEKMQQCIGSCLFNTFFPPGPLRDALHDTIDRVEGNASARIELRLDTDATGLGLYPWELIYDGERREFLFSGRTPGIVRYIAYTKPAPGLLTTERLRVLFVAARPVDPSQVQLLPDLEDAQIGQGLADANAEKSIALDVLPPASPGHPTYDLLAQALDPVAEDQRTHVLHFDGHGGFGILCTCGRLNRVGASICIDPGCKKPLNQEAQGYLAFERANKAVDWISAEEFANLLKGAGIRLVVLTACKSAVAAGESVFSGVAPALIGAGIPAVVAMQYSISAAASSHFAQVFYRSLGQGGSLIAAMGQVRVALFAPYPESWYRPVLFLRVNEANPEGKLFAIVKKKDEKGKKIPKRTIVPVSPAGVVFGDHAYIAPNAMVAGRDNIKNETVNVAQLELPTTGRYELTGDYQIDQVQQTLGTLSQLNTLGQRREVDIPLEELFPQLSQLFRRGAFEEYTCRQNNQSIKLLLYAVTATELILREWRPTIKRHGKMGDLEDYDALRDEVVAMKNWVAAEFGSDFSLANHIQKYGKHKDSFVNALPDPVNKKCCDEAEPHRKKAVELAHQLFDRR